MVLGEFVDKLHDVMKDLMSNIFPASLLKPVARLLLQQYLGPLLKGEIDSSQISIDNVTDQEASMHDLELNAPKINEKLLKYNVPIAVIDAFIKEVNCKVSLLHGSMITITGLELTLHPKERLEEFSPAMMDSMFMSCNEVLSSSMESSRMMAQECMTAESGPENQPPPIQGVERLTKFIHDFITKTRVEFIDTVIRIEHIPKGASAGVAAELHVQRFAFTDGGTPESEEASDLNKMEDSLLQNRLRTFQHKIVEITAPELRCEQVKVSTIPTPHGGRLASDDSAGSSPSSLETRDYGNLNLTEDNRPPQGLSEGDNSYQLPSLVAALKGKLTLNIKIKENEDVTGPKVEVDACLGQLFFHVTPAQVMILQQLVEGIAFPDSCDEKNLKSLRRRTVNRRMGQADFDRLQRELQKVPVKQPMRGSRLGQQMGSQDADSEIFETVHNWNRAHGTHSTHTGARSTAHSTYTGARSTASSATRPTTQFETATGCTGKSQGSRGYIGAESYADLLKVRLKVNFVAGVILEQEPLDSPPDPTEKVSSAEDKLRQMAESYFTRVNGVFASVSITQTLSELRKAFAEACPFDHLSFLCKPLTVETSHSTSAGTPSHMGGHSSRRGSSKNSLDVLISMAEAELVEVLFNRSCPTHDFFSNLHSRSYQSQQSQLPPAFYEILVFEENNDPNAAAITVKIHSLDNKSGSWSSTQGAPQCKTEVQVELMPCIIEVDVTLVDRLDALLNPPPIVPKLQKLQVESSIYASCQTFLGNQGYLEPPTPERKTSLKIVSPKAEVILRFPIPDLSEKNERPWWKRHLRRELLIFRLQEVEILSSFWIQQPASMWEIYCRSGIVLLHESAADDPVPVGQFSSEEYSLLEREAGCDWPRLVVKVFPASVFNPLQDPVTTDFDVDMSHFDSLSGACKDIRKPEISVFSQKYHMFDNQEKKMPGDRQELEEFEEHTLNNCRVLLDVNLPNMNLLIPSKGLLELLYNRVLNDLALWQPQAPTPMGPELGSLNMAVSHTGWGVSLVEQMTKGQMMGEATNDMFQECRMNAPYESDSDSDYSMGQHESVSPRQAKTHAKAGPSSNQSKMCLRLNVGTGRINGRIHMQKDELVPSQEEGTGEDCSLDDMNVGEFELLVQNAGLLVATTFDGDPYLSYLCVHAHQTAFYHQGCLPHPIPRQELGRADWNKTPSNLPCVIKVSEKGVIEKADDLESREHMLSVAVKIKENPDKKVKDCLVSLGIRAGTLTHRVTEWKNHWLKQFFELFALQDEEITGYVPLKVLTELHVHIWNCAILYKPIHLKYGAVLTFDSFSISSNVVAECSSTALRFLVEDAALYLTDKKSKARTDLREDFVCVAEVNLFDLSLKTQEERLPKFELLAGVSKLQLHTCADSGRALVDLINYLATDGDLAASSTDSATDLRASNQKPATREASNQNVSAKHSATNQIAASPPVLQIPLVTNDDGFGLMGDDLTPVAAHGDAPLMEMSHTGSLHELMADALRERDDTYTDLTYYSSPGSSHESTPPKSPDARPYTVYFNKSLQQDEDDSISLMSSMASERGMSASRGSEGGMLESLRSERGKQREAVNRDGGSKNPKKRSGAEAKKQPRSLANLDQDFLLLDVQGHGTTLKDGQPQVRGLKRDTITIIDDFFKVPQGKSDVLKAPKHLPQAIYKYTMREGSLEWNMYGGRDFESSPPSKTTEKSDSALKHERFGRHIPHAKTSNTSKERVVPEHLRRRCRGGRLRDLDSLLVAKVIKVSLQHEVYPENTKQASRQVVVVREFEVSDQMSGSEYKYFMKRYTNDAQLVQSCREMLDLRTLFTRPETEGHMVMPQECSIKSKLQPVQVFVRQITLKFIHTFFRELMEEQGEPLGADVAARQQHSSYGGPDHPPVLQLGHGVMGNARASRRAGQNVQFDELSDGSDGACSVPDQNTDTQAQPECIFFNYFKFDSSLIVIDYEGDQIFDQKSLAAVLLALAKLHGSQIHLKTLHYRRGLKGVDKLVQYAVKEWTDDITKNQISNILKGISPFKSISHFIQGVFDLVWLPIEQYRRDGRVIRGLQRGTKSFFTRTITSSLEITNRVVVLVHWCAEQGYIMTVPIRHSGPSRPRYRLKDPADAREGLSNAYTVVSEGIKQTAGDIYEDYVVGQEQRGWPGAVGAVVRHMPPTVLQPVIISSEATRNILSGLCNQLQPERHREEANKWKPEDDRTFPLPPHKKWE